MSAAPPQSGFTAGCREQALGAWRATTAWPEKYGAWKKGPGIGGRAQRGCLGVLIFGLVYVVVPLTVFLFVESALVCYALLMSGLWGIGAAAGALRPAPPRSDAG